MGIYIHLNVSNKVTPEQWEKAYEESLILVEKFNLVEHGVIEKFGSQLRCLIHTKERDFNGDVGWRTVSEGRFLKTGEDHFLPRKISEPNPLEEYVDPLMYVLAQKNVVSFENPCIYKIHEYFGNKTQGEPYHYALLAIGCLLDDRLNGEAICSGDITYGQCEYTINFANQFLERPIKNMLRLDMNRLYERVCKLPVEKEKILQAFEAAYLGPKNKEYYDFVNKKFSDEDKQNFINGYLKNCRLGTFGFSEAIRRILTYPFTIAEICKIFVAMNPEAREDEKETMNPYKIFIEHILETNIFVQEKDLRNCLDVDEGSGELMTIEKLFAGFLFGGARNMNVDRFEPLDELKRDFISVFGDKCDVEKIVDAYIKKQNEKTNDSCSVLNDWHDDFNKEYAKASEEFDVIESDDLPFYKKGQTIQPKLLKKIKDRVKFYKEITKEAEYANVSKKDFKEKFKFFALQDNHLCLMKETWEKILKEIEEKPETFERYYPMARVKITSDSEQNISRAYVENNEFYEFCQGLILAH